MLSRELWYSDKWNVKNTISSGNSNHLIWNIILLPSKMLLMTMQEAGTKRRILMLITFWVGEVDLGFCQGTLIQTTWVNEKQFLIYFHCSISAIRSNNFVVVSRANCTDLRSNDLGMNDIQEAKRKHIQLRQKETFWITTNLFFNFRHFRFLETRGRSFLSSLPITDYDISHVIRGFDQDTDWSITVGCVWRTNFSIAIHYSLICSCIHFSPYRNSRKKFQHLFHPLASRKMQ